MVLSNCDIVSQHARNSVGLGQRLVGELPRFWRIVHLADQFGTADILTLDPDFAICRWGKNKPFRLRVLPD